MPLSSMVCLIVSLQDIQSDMCDEGYTCRYWALALSGAKVGGKTVGNLSSTGALLDSGTSLIFTSDADAAALNNVCFSLIRSHDQCKAVRVHVYWPQLCKVITALDVPPYLPMPKPLA